MPGGDDEASVQPPLFGTEPMVRPRRVPARWFACIQRDDTRLRSRPATTPQRDTGTRLLGRSKGRAPVGGPDAEQQVIEDWNDIGELKRVILDRMIEDRNTYARGVVESVEADAKAARK